MAKTLLHTFATAGYLPWLELLLESVWFHSADTIDIRVDALNLASADVERLETTYPNLDLRNRELSDEQIAGEIGVPTSQLLAWKSQIEDARVSNRNFLYKVFISVNQRYRAMDRVIREARDAGYDGLVHADADLYVRTDLSKSPLIQEILRNDVSLYINDSLIALQHHRKVLGAFLCFNLGGNIDPFIDTWMSEIDRVPFLKRWKGYGQSVLWYAINEVEGVRIRDLNAIADSFKPSRRFEPDGDIWFASNTRSLSTRIKKRLALRGSLGGGAESRRRCRRDFETLRKERSYGRDEQGQTG